MENIKTYVMCHNQDIILYFINNGKYNNIGEYKFLFLGYGDTDKIKDNNQVIICRDLPNNIEQNKNCLQYCAWYALFYNNLIDSQYIRFVDYDIDIINHNIHTDKKIKGTIGFNFDFYFKEGFGDNTKFNQDIFNYCGKDIDTLINEYTLKYGITKWFSSIDTIIHTDTLKEFMGWFYNYYVNNTNNFYFGMHFERFIMIYCMMVSIDCEISENETIHHQAMSHKYY